MIAINTTTVTFAQNSTSTQKYESANTEVSNNVIIKNSGVIINGTYYSIAEFESLLDHAILISETGNSSARIAAIGAGIYFIPGIGEVVIAATGAITVAGVTITVGTWLYKTITNWLSNSSKRKIAKIRASIPKRLRKKNGDVNLGKVIDKLGQNDLLIITADHGNDPTYQGTDHTREYVPFLAYSPAMKGEGVLGIKESFATIGATLAENFNLKMPENTIGESVLNELV